MPSIGAMRESVIICTTVERPDDDISTLVTRPGVFRCHARLRNMRPDQILDYMAVNGTEDRPTIEVCIRYPPDTKIDLGHWVYLETGEAKIWLKVRSVEDLGYVHLFLLLNCSIDWVNDRRSDPATQRSPPAWEMPILNDNEIL